MEKNKHIYLTIDTKDDKQVKIFAERPILKQNAVYSNSDLIPSAHWEGDMILSVDTSRFPEVTVDNSPLEMEIIEKSENKHYFDNTQEYILCAAIKRKQTFKNSQSHLYLNEIYDCELGWRHPDILEKFRGIVSTDPKDQGFFTSKGRFVSREEAAKIVYACGQIITKWKIATLFSEDLY